MSYKSRVHVKDKATKVRLDQASNKEFEEIAYEMRIQKAVLGRVVIENFINLYRLNKGQDLLIPIQVDTNFNLKLEEEARKQGISKDDLIKQFISSLLNDTKEIVAA